MSAIYFSLEPMFTPACQDTSWGTAVELFHAEKIAELESAATRRCRSCGGELALIKTIVDFDSGKVTHMFKCRCGDRIWED